MHAGCVIQAIPYAAQSEIFAMAPVCFTPSFRVARVALAKEYEMLLVENESGVNGPLLVVCGGLRDLVDQHIEWVTGQKIAVKVDFDATWPRSAT